MTDRPMAAEGANIAMPKRRLTCRAALSNAIRCVSPMWPLTATTVRKPSRASDRPAARTTSCTARRRTPSDPSMGTTPEPIGTGGASTLARSGRRLALEQVGAVGLVERACQLAALFEETRQVRQGSPVPAQRDDGLVHFALGALQRGRSLFQVIRHARAPPCAATADDPAAARRSAGRTRYRPAHKPCYRPTPSPAP